ncbi:MAG: hypothetical protein WD716_10120 [Fimbriimonadaceae bacterium]
MASNRIKKRPDELRDQLLQAAAAITAAGLAWPSGAPTDVQVTAEANAIGASIIAIDGFVNSASTRRQQRETEMATGTDTMGLIDGFTTGLYGADGAEKANFGLPPIILPGPPLGPPDQITDLKLADGQLPASIFADCESIAGASYEWEWYSDAALTTRVGNTTTTPSELVINGLTTGTRYWVRARAIRGGQTGMWSDPDSRVANV